MGLMGCTACGGISYPPLHKWASWCEKYITKRLVKHRQFTDFWLVRPLQGLKKTSTNKMLTSREQKYWGSYLAKKWFHGNKKLSWLFTSYSWTTFTFLPILHDTQKKSFPTDWKIELLSNSESHKIGKDFLWNRLQKRAGSVACELETKTKLTFFFRTLVAHYNPKDFLVDKLNCFIDLHVFTERGIWKVDTSSLSEEASIYTNTMPSRIWRSWRLLCSSKHADIFPPLFYKKKCTHTPLNITPIRWKYTEYKFCRHSH